MKILTPRRHIQIAILSRVQFVRFLSVEYFFSITSKRFDKHNSVRHYLLSDILRL